MPELVILDGGLATQLEAQGHDLSSALWSARLLVDEPDAIVEAHRAYFSRGRGRRDHGVVPGAARADPAAPCGWRQQARDDARPRCDRRIARPVRRPSGRRLGVSR